MPDHPTDERREAARIPLRGRDGTVRAHALVDAEDFERLSKYTWCLSNGYAARTVHRGGKWTTLTMHRLILGLESPGGGKRDSRHGDHINGDKLDNRRANLRVADWELNSQNMRPTARNKSGYLCVFKASSGSPVLSCSVISSSFAAIPLGGRPPSEGPTTSAVEHRRSETEVAGSSPAGRSDRSAEQGEGRRDSLYDFREETLIELRDLLTPLEDLPQSDRLLRLIDAALAAKQAPTEPAEKPGCLGCSMPVGKSHREDCPYARSRRVNTMQTRIKPLAGIIPTTAEQGERRSRCCNAPLRVDSADEGTSCYVCEKCGQPSDPAEHPETGERERWTARATIGPHGLTATEAAMQRLNRAFRHRPMHTSAERFDSEAACLAYVEQIRWPNGFVCPHCGVIDEPWRMKGGTLRCKACRKRTSITSGTIFDKTRYPMRTWFHVMWHVCGQKNGVSALGLKRELGFGSYQTAWAWMHKLRRAMVRPDRDMIGGPGVVVEVDETFVGGVKSAKVKGRSPHGKAIVVIAVEAHEHGAGRVRLARVKDTTADTLTEFVLDNVKRGSIIHTDAYGGYNDIGKLNYKHTITNMSDPETADAHVAMPHAHRVASLLKRWLLGTHQGGMSREQLDYYLDEYVFRFNRRSSRSRGLLFYRLIEQGVVTEPHPYRNLLTPQMKML